MREPRTWKISRPRDCYLSLGCQSAKREGVNDAGPIASEFGSTQTLGWLIEKAFAVRLVISGVFGRRFKNHSEQILVFCSDPSQG